MKIFYHSETKSQVFLYIFGRSTWCGQQKHLKKGGWGAATNHFVYMLAEQLKKGKQDVYLGKRREKVD